MTFSVTFSQILIIALLFGLLAVFAADRFRTETVAIAGLVLGVVFGLVPPDRIFSGLTNPAVITVIEVLLVVHALDRSHVFDRVGDWLHRRFASPFGLVMAMSGLAACLSSVMNNVAAFSLMLPACFSVMRAGRIPARWIFLPLSYATLLGGLWTSIGTPPNLIASSFLQQSEGVGFAFLDFAPIGLTTTVAGFIVLMLWLPKTLLSGEDEHTVDERFAVRRVMTDLLVPSGKFGRLPVSSLEEVLDGRIHNVVRDGRRIFPLRAETSLAEKDRILIEANPRKLEEALSIGLVSYGRRSEAVAERTRIRAVVMPQSLLAGSCIAAFEPLEDFDVEILQIEGEPVRFDGPYEELPFRVGNILLLEGEEASIRSFIAYSDLIEVAGELETEPEAAGFMPLAVFAIGVLAAASGLLSPEIALAGVVAVLCLMGRLDLRAGLRNLNWPIVLILVAMLPLGEAVGTTGAALAIAREIANYLPGPNEALAVFFMLAMAMAITPFVNNATTVAILAPIALELARTAQIPPQAVVMAVAVGASCDFLTPFGHHNNTLAYGLGGYRFIEFLKVGWPLSVAVYLAAGTSIILYW